MAYGMFWLNLLACLTVPVQVHFKNKKEKKNTEVVAPKEKKQKNDKGLEYNNERGFKNQNRY